MSQVDRSLDQVVQALLYEGYLLFPYRQSSRKNHVRWNFGCVMPPNFALEQKGSERSSVQVECLALPRAGCSVAATVRCLQLMNHQRPGQEPWQEAEERSVGALVLPLEGDSEKSLLLDFELPGGEEADGVGGRRTWRPLRGRVSLEATPVALGAVRVRAVIANRTEVARGLDRSQAVERALASCHAILKISEGEFCSAIEPPEELAQASADCQNLGLWPVLVGAEGERDTVLASPIILEDYPRVAADSAGNLFDSTEIDELLSLNIRSLTEEERKEILAGDEVGRRLLERTEALDEEELLRMHASALRPTPGAGGAR